MNDRESQFTSYYCMSVYSMRIAKYCLQMAKTFCAHGIVKRSLHLAELTMDSKITDVTLRLKDDSRSDIQHDLASDDLMALGNILTRLTEIPSISDVEGTLIDFIKEIKKVQNEKLESAYTGAEKE